MVSASGALGRAAVAVVRAGTSTVEEGGMKEVRSEGFRAAPKGISTYPAGVLAILYEQVLPKDIVGLI